MSNKVAMDYIIKKIAGIDCIFIPMSWVNSITTRVRVKAGANYETDKEHGISHFLEHIHFLGGKKWGTAKELRDFVRDIGGEFNAATGDYRTSYYINSPYEYGEDQLDVLGDMVVDSLFPTDAVENEKGVVIQEIKRVQDDNAKEAYYKGRMFFMGDNSYGHDLLGTEENIKSFKREDFFKYKSDLYTKDNIVIVIAGKIENQNKLERLIEIKFGKLEESRKRSLPKFMRDLPVEHEKYIEKGINQPRVSMFVPGISCVSDGSICCSLLAEIVRRRLFQKIREELGLCYGIRMVHIDQVKYGFFLMETGLQKDKLSFGLEKINEVIDELLKFGIEKKELESIKNSKKGSMLINYETPSKIADFVVNCYITIDKIIFPENRAQEFSEITMEDVEKVLPLLERNNRYTFYIR